MSATTRTGTDEVLVEGSPLPEGATMHVYERAVTLADGTTVWLRRWWEPNGLGRRVYLDGFRWCALRGGSGLYARPLGMGASGHRFEWAFKAPYAFASWELALAAAMDAEAAEQGARRAS